MKRILIGWTMTRVLFLLLGVVMVAQSVWDKQWIGAILGSYFAAMGLFSFGCAAGHCFGSSCETHLEQKANSDV